MDIRVDRLTKSFASTPAVRDVSFRVSSGALVALLGPSGSGKTTILRLLAGLERADGGTVHFGGRDVTHVPARERSIGFVFQSYALFRHLTVADNVAFGLEVRRVGRERIRERVRELLGLVGLESLGQRLPSQLSGGQRQRVALARALAPEPALLLLDEPFGAVDAKVREELRQWLRKLHDDAGITSIFVTHDQDEAWSVADRVLVIHDGAVEQSGTPAQILDDPATEQVARFVGEVNVLPAVARAGTAVAGALCAPIADRAAAGPVSLVVRSYDLRPRRAQPGIATVERIVFLGDRVRVHAAVDDAGPVVCQLPRERFAGLDLEPGCRIAVDVTAARAYPAAAAER